MAGFYRDHLKCYDGYQRHRWQALINNEIHLMVYGSLQKTEMCYERRTTFSFHLNFTHRSAQEAIHNVASDAMLAFILYSFSPQRWNIPDQRWDSTTRRSLVAWNCSLRPIVHHTLSIRCLNNLTHSIIRSNINWFNSMPSIGEQSYWALFHIVFNKRAQARKIDKRVQQN